MGPSRPGSVNREFVMCSITQQHNALARIFRTLAKFSVSQSEPKGVSLRNSYETTLAKMFLNTNRGVRDGT
jgi:hypothetical protein